MAYQLTFARRLHYNPGKEGIAVGVILKLDGRSEVVEAKIDTGASCCIFARVHGENLGLDIESGLRQLFSTATGAFTAYGHEVTLTVMDDEFDTLIYFAEDAGFSRNVLGRRGWLDRVRLGLVDYDGELYVSRYDAPDM
ncbi:MAG TPA: hypothetical protein VNO70_02175 [Blastocatellia bacterium]|nr:hypothetical protein [Blastocatellia bacterium]